MIKAWDIISMHWLKFEVCRSYRGDGWYLHCLHAQNNKIFNILWINDKYTFCGCDHNRWQFPYHDSAEHLERTIEKLKSYGEEPDIYQIIW
jgi:hypothetical protein